MQIANYVGIDMAKLSFYACLKEDKDEKKWNNNVTGINSFFRYLKRNDFDIDNTVIGVESTGSYHLPVCFQSKRTGYIIKVINPLITKKQNQTTLRRIKNDKFDSRLIRYCLVNGDGYEFKETEENLILKNLIRQRDSFSKIKTKIKIQQMDIDYKEDIIKQPISNLYKEIYQTLEEKIKILEKELAKYNKKTQTLLRTIPGVGPITAASFVSEVNDIKRFKYPKQLVAYCGIDPRVYESGTSVKGRGHITKRGNKILRTRLYNACNVAVLRENMFQDFFQKKIKEGKPYRVALVATMRKMVHVIHAVWTREAPFKNQIPAPK